MPEPTTAGALSAREQEFLEAEADRFGWDHYHVEDAVAFARMFRAERDEARAALAQAERERDAAYEQAAKWCEERAEKIRAYAAKTPKPDARQRRYDAAEWVQGCADSIRFRAAPPPEEEASRG